MARNLVEYHIQDGALHTFKVAAGQTVKIGQIVEVVGDRTVATAKADSEKAIGVVYSGTVGKDGLKVGYLGDENDVVTVVSLKPLVYLEAGGAVTAGAQLKTGEGGTVVPAVSATGNGYDSIGMALEGGTRGQHILAILG